MMSKAFAFPSCTLNRKLRFQQSPQPLKPNRSERSFDRTLSSLLVSVRGSVQCADIKHHISFEYSGMS